LQATSSLLLLGVRWLFKLVVEATEEASSWFILLFFILFVYLKKKRRMRTSIIRGERRTGKTTRLLQKLVASQQEGGEEVVLLCVGKLRATQLRARTGVEEVCAAHDAQALSLLAGRLNNRVGGSGRKEEWHLFVDDFDFIPQDRLAAFLAQVRVLPASMTITKTERR